MRFELDAVLDAMETKKRPPRAPKAIVSKIKAKIKATGHKRAGPEIFNL